MWTSLSGYLVRARVPSWTAQHEVEIVRAYSRGPLLGLGLTGDERRSRSGGAHETGAVRGRAERASRRARRSAGASCSAVGQANGDDAVVAGYPARQLPIAHRSGA